VNKDEYKITELLAVFCLYTDGLKQFHEETICGEAER